MGGNVLGGRLAFVNVWLPISSEPIQREPLAVCDWRSRSAILDDWVDEAAQHRPSHQWYYFSGMLAGQALIFKQWDSAYESAPCKEAARLPVPRETLHTAFNLPHEPTTAAPRQSCEVRLLVVFEDT